MDGMEVNSTFAQHRDEVLAILAEYQRKRIRFYETAVDLKRLLKKDIAMFALRGVQTVPEFVENAFNAVDSSSEETVMGNTWQQILAQISSNTLDTGDLTTVRDGVLWVCELKSQANTVNANSLPQELRGLRVRQQEIASRARSSRQPVKTALCVARDGKGVDEVRTYGVTDSQRRDSPDLVNFEYRYITGEKFWQWIAGYDSEISLLMPLSDIEGQHVRQARQAAIARLTLELSNRLDENGFDRNIDGIVELRDLLL